ncbi:MAG: hypothetical protein C4540_05970 [Candidatus Omnitrophota bacterium]|jgi:hypothetical protein|nr:MAG: hypothetical protein C4540_05970 [Candidatus Omnitrophota bacterium]
MKKLSVVLALFLSVSLVATCYAASSAEIDVAVNLPSTIELSWGMAKVDSMLTEDPGDDAFTGNQTVMNFDQLRHLLADGITEAGRWYSRYYYALFVSAVTAGQRYQLTSQSDGLWNGGTRLAKGWGVTAVSCWDTTADASMDCPSGAALGNPGPADGALVLYSSGDGAAVQTVRADYAIPNVPPADTGFEPIPLNQLSGDYTGKVTVSVVAY